MGINKDIMKTVRVPDDKIDDVKSGKLHIDGVDLRDKNGHYAGKLEVIKEEPKDEVTKNSETPDSDIHESNDSETSAALFMAIGTLIGSGVSFIVYKGKLLNDKQKTLIFRLESKIRPYSETIMMDVHNKESVKAMSEFLTAVQEITTLKIPLFIKTSNSNWDSFVELIYLYTQELIKDTQEVWELPELPKKKLLRNHFVNQLRFIEECLLIQQEIITDAVENIPPKSDENIQVKKVSIDFEN